ncbi:MAG TPA: rRNA maturation RNase YbeY [Chloroflexota bacterium]|nr:rRNA maturation RNase YbeY [Chloroflexota bacterium]
MAFSLDLELRDETASAAEHLELLRRVVQRAVAGEGLDGSYQVTVTLVSDDEIRDLNKTHRGKDEVTDVLSFPLTEGDAASFVLPDEVPTHLGDVVVSTDRARAQAAELGHSFERELAYLAVHGTLHLLGYDHEDDGEKVRMRAREEHALADLPR